MNTQEKKRFIRDLMGSVQKELLGKVLNMPEHWDGIEIRQRIAEKFASETFPHMLIGKRKREYRNTCIVNNL